MNDHFLVATLYHVPNNMATVLGVVRSLAARGDWVALAIAKPLVAVLGEALDDALGVMYTTVVAMGGWELVKVVRFDRLVLVELRVGRRAKAFVFGLAPVAFVLALEEDGAVFFRFEAAVRVDKLVLVVVLVPGFFL